MSNKTRRKIGRNDPCSCGSGIKYKKCCGRGDKIGESLDKHTFTIDLKSGKSSGSLPEGMFIGHPRDESANAKEFSTQQRDGVETEIIIQLTSPIPFVGDRYSFRQGNQLGCVTLDNDNVIVNYPSHVLDPQPSDRPPAHSAAIEETISHYNVIVDYFNALSPLPIPKQTANDVKRAWITWRDRDSGRELAHRHYIFHGIAPKIERSAFKALPNLDLEKLRKNLRDHLFEIESAAKESFHSITTSEWGSSLLEFINTLCCVLEDTGETFFSMEEKKIRDVFLTALSMGFPGFSVGESFAVHGKTDLRIYKPDNTRFRPSVKLEFKNWNGPASATQSLNQLLAYSTGDEEWIGLIFVFRQKNIEQIYVGVEEFLARFPGINSLHLNQKEPRQRIICNGSISMRGIDVPLKTFVLDFGGRDYR